MAGEQQVTKFLVFFLGRSRNVRMQILGHKTVLQFHDVRFAIAVQLLC